MSAPPLRVVLHFPTAYSAPVGIWWWNSVTACPNSYYLPGEQNYQSLAVDILGRGRDQAHWDSLSQNLCDATPVADAFEADTTNVSPQAYLKALQRK